MNFRQRFFLFAAMGAAFLSGASCVNIDENLGKNLIATDQTFDIYTAEIPLTDIDMEMADSLSGLSSKRITLGAVRDETFGLTSRCCALTLVPVWDKDYDVGEDPVFRSMHFSTALDTVSVPSPAERYILQNVRVYELSEPLDLTKARTNTDVPHRGELITDGAIVFNGRDSLSFDFTRSFGERYLTIDAETELDTMPHFTSRFPGIYVEMEEPVGNGGRINLFDLSCLNYSSSYNSYYLNGNCARLYFTSTYDGVRKDTSFVFVAGEPWLVDEEAYLDESQRFPQYAYNITRHETRPVSGRAADRILVEGGGGLKPVIRSRDLLDKVRAEIGAHGDPSSAIINRAQIELPFDYDGDYEALGTFFPSTLSPTCRIVTEGVGASFAGLSDSSASDEDQGTIHRDLLCYAPDIAHHLQELLRQGDDADFDIFDIWLLIMASETTVTENSNNLSSEYQQLAYYNYLNSLYNGYGYGYGGYGYGYGGYGYGGYNSSYYNYYNYMMMASMYSSSSTTSTSTELDKDRYYKAVLRGPEAGGRVPTLSITYSIPR